MSKDFDVVQEILGKLEPDNFDNQKYKTRKPKPSKPHYHTQYDYSLQDIAKASVKEQIKLANHFMAVMNQRLRAFEKKGYQADSEWYQKNVGRFVTNAKDLTPEKRGMAIQELQRELNRADSTTTGYEKIREKILKTLHNKDLHGDKFAFVTEENLAEWGAFMDYLRDEGAVTYYDVEEMQELWVIYEQYGAYSFEFVQAFHDFMHSPTTSYNEERFKPNEYNT